MVNHISQISDETLAKALNEVCDPEIPVLTILDMGIVQEVVLDNNDVYIKITPTYTGCPAMDTISADIISNLKNHGYNAQVELVLSPAWTTDWISEEGRKKLVEYGIAAPLEDGMDKAVLLKGERAVQCPQCNSTNTQMVSQFGSTPCKALFKCDDCLEPFDYFKCLK